MIKTRIAPTPSGYLHIGNLFNFLLIQYIVKRKGGTIVLRIDDIDRARFRNEYLQAIFDTLNISGITYNDGPRSLADFANYSQLNHLNKYEILIDQLKLKGHLFACNCTRKMLDNTEQYPGTCLEKNLPFTDEFSWRLISSEQPVIFYDSLKKLTQEINLYEIMRHPVMRKRDGYPSYQVVSLADDLRMGVNTIVRGEDLENSTATQLYIADLLGLHAFRNVNFYHHPLINNAGGEKLSKSGGSGNVLAYIETYGMKQVISEFENWKSSFMK